MALFMVARLSQEKWIFATYSTSHVSVVSKNAYKQINSVLC
jgi:hypothetical protein